MTHSRPTLSALLDRSGLAPRRDLGQNFVVDPNTVRRIAELARVGEGDSVVEVGAGLGSLTLALAETGAAVTAVEVDRGIVPVLREVTADANRVRVVEGDAMSLDWGSLLEGSTLWTLVANLPYNVATPLILDLLRDVPAITEMLVMVQFEVAERLAATAPDPAIGIPSVLVAYHGRAEVVGRVPPTVFHPKPRVDSALVRIVRHEHPPVDTSLDRLEPLVRAAYNQRRKMIRKSLSGLRTVEQIEAAGVDPQARPETLDLAAWGRLADA